MGLQINYDGLKRAERRDRKYRKRRKLAMTEDGRSVKLLAKIIQDKAKDAGMERLPTNMSSMQ